MFTTSDESITVLNDIDETKRIEVEDVISIPQDELDDINQHLDGSFELIELLKEDGMAPNKKGLGLYRGQASAEEESDEPAQPAQPKAKAKAKKDSDEKMIVVGAGLLVLILFLD